MSNETLDTPITITAATDPAGIRALIRDYVRMNFLYDGTNTPLDDATSLTGEGIVDETGFLEMALFVEEAWGLHVAPADMTPDNFDSIDALTHYIIGRQGTAS
ncbi:MAG TPA: hypothetical protein VIC85_11155 [Ktedonobacterales bacterium]|jgi:acyl carrier protein